MPKWFFVGLLLIVFSAPGGVLSAPATKPGAAPSKPGAGLSRIVVFYPKPKTDSGLAKLIGRISIKLTISIDDKPVFNITRGGHSEVAVAPGVRRIKIKHADDPLGSILLVGWTYDVTVRPGKTQYFYMIHGGSGFFLSEVNPATAEAEIAGRPAAGSGTVILFWPRKMLDFGLTDFLNPDRDVTFNGRKAGAFTIGDYIVLQAPAGNVDLGFPESLELFGTHQHTIFVGSGQTHYYQLHVGDYLQVIERTPAFAQQFIPGLKKR